MITQLGHTDLGEEVKAVQITNTQGALATILNYGAIVSQLWIPRSQGPAVNVVLGFDDWRKYLNDSSYLGAMVGRCCNRIRNAGFTLNGEPIELNANLGPHQLHGGSEGFNRRVWTITAHSDNTVTLMLQSPHGDQGFPGNVDVSVKYTLRDDNSLVVTWEASTDRETIVNLTNHSYFNLAGEGDILDHSLRIDASQFTPVDTDIIPTGETADVANTILDLRKALPLGAIIDSEDPLMAICGGLDHNFILDQPGGETTVAELSCPRSGLTLQVATTQPGLQCYSGNMLSEGGVHPNRAGVCLETQDFPNAANEPHFPSVRLLPGNLRSHTTLYRVVDTAR